jgi:hypothetical protein
MLSDAKLDVKENYFLLQMLDEAGVKSRISSEAS